MRISDWSSDVCSSDLRERAHQKTVTLRNRACQYFLNQIKGLSASSHHHTDTQFTRKRNHTQPHITHPFHHGSGLVRSNKTRSEERRVGKECGSTGRTRRTADP